MTEQVFQNYLQWLMGDRIIVMKQDKIEEMGAAEQIYRDPQQDYTRQLISAIPKGF